MKSDVIRYGYIQGWWLCEVLEEQRCVYWSGVRLKVRVNGGVYTFEAWLVEEKRRTL